MWRLYLCKDYWLSLAFRIYPLLILYSFWWFSTFFNCFGIQMNIKVQQIDFSSSLPPSLSLCCRSQRNWRVSMPTWRLRSRSWSSRSSSWSTCSTCTGRPASSEPKTDKRLRTRGTSSSSTSKRAPYNSTTSPPPPPPPRPHCPHPPPQ